MEAHGIDFFEPSRRCSLTDPDVDESLQTALYEVEAVLNDRPITAVTCPSYDGQLVA